MLQLLQMTLPLLVAATLLTLMAVAAGRNAACSLARHVAVKRLLDQEVGATSVAQQWPLWWTLHNHGEAT